MGDSAISNKATDSTTTAPATQSPDASHKLAQDAAPQPSNMSLGTKAERVAEVTIKGLADAVPGAVNAAGDFFQPKNWGKDAEMIGSAAVMGLALRTALPESGMIAKSVGLVMGGTFAIGGLKNVTNAWGTVTKYDGSQAMNTAATNMGNGLGEFAVDGAVSMAAGGIGAKETPKIWNKVDAEKWNSLENWKSENLSDTSSIGAMLGRAGDRFHSFTSSLADKIHPSGKTNPVDTDPIAARRSMIANRQSMVADANSNSIYRFGARGADGTPLGLNGTVDALVGNSDPATIVGDRAANHPLDLPARGPAKLGLVDMTDPANASGPGLIVPDRSVVRSGLLVPRDANTTASGLVIPDGIRAASGDGSVHTSASGTSAAPQTEMERVLNPTTMTQQAAVIRSVLNSVSPDQELAIDALHRTTGAVHVRTSPGVSRLEGYDPAREAMFQIANRYGYVPIFDGFADAAVQSGTAGASDVGNQVAMLNRYAKQNYTTYYNNILQAGADPKVALQGRPSPPLFKMVSDLTPDGGHMGPHTNPAQDIFPVDIIEYPVRELGVRGINVPGVYGHEAMHDQYGHLGNFDAQTRDATLNKAAGDVLGSDANTTIDVPNGGVDPQKVLLNNVERVLSSGKITDPADREAYLTDSLQLSPRMRAYKAETVADQMLGDMGQKQGVKTQDGAIPLTDFVAQIAAQADTRTPDEALSEFQGKADTAAMNQKIGDNIDQMLGNHGSMPVKLEDGTPTTLKNLIMQVSENSRNEFLTYDKPLPKTITKQDLLVNVARAWDNETFADWGAAAESGQSAAPYFQALRPDGRLSRSTVMMQDMRSDDNPMGIEVHPVDKLRPQIQAAMIRELATAKGGNDQMLLDWADALDKYAKSTGQSGDVQIALGDAPGQKITIPEQQLVDYFGKLAHEQLYQPLPRLQGKTMFDILPDLRKNFRANWDLSDQWASAIKNGQSPDTLPFDAAKTKVTNVYGAGQLAFLKLTADGMDPLQANDAINQYIDHFGEQYNQQGDPHVGTSFAKRLQLAPAHTLKTEVPQYFAKPVASALRATPQASTFLGRNAFAIGAGSGAYTINDLLGMHQVQQEMLNQPTATGG